MNILLSRLWILAESDFIHMGNRFRRGGSGLDGAAMLRLLVLLTLAGLVIWAGVRLWQWYEKRNQNDPRRLFDELCRIHRLSRSDRLLLAELARQHELPHPACLFLQPELFVVRGPAQPRIEQLRETLFSGN